MEQELSEAADVGMFNVGLSALLANPIESQANPGYIRALLGLGPSEETDRC